MTSQSSDECLFCYAPSADPFCSTACREAWWIDADFRPEPRRRPEWN